MPAIEQRDSLRLAVLVFAVGLTEFGSDIDHWAGGRIVATLVGAGVTIVVCAVATPPPGEAPPAPRRRRDSARTHRGPGVTLG